MAHKRIQFKVEKQRTFNRLYTASQRYLHWLVAVLVLVQYATQVPMRAAISSIEHGRQLTAMGFLVTTLHSLGGLAVLVLVFYRLNLRRQRPVEPGGYSANRLLRACALGLHRVLYGLLLWMAISGAAHYFVGWAWAARMHELGKWLLAGAVLAHLMAALWHHFVQKDAVLLQMLRKPPPPDTMRD